MKKILIVLSILVIFAVCLSACEVVTSNSDYTKFNNMIATERSSVAIEVKTTLNGETLTNKFHVEKKNGKSIIEYRIETMNKFSIEGANEDSYKTVSEGTVEVEGDKITQLNGKHVDYAFNKITSSTFTFKASYFSKSKITETTIELDVKNPSAFIGQSAFDGKEVKFSATFNDYNLFETMTLTYLTKNGLSVEITYTYPNA